jgi:flagellar M-ring protein FliF
LKFLQDIFNRIRGWFAGVWEKTEKRDRTRFVVISGIAAVLIAAAMIMLNTSKYTELINSNNPAALRSAAQILTENNIRFRQPGNTIMVDRRDEAAASAALIAQGDISLDLDFSIYERATGIMSTDADRKVYNKYHTEGQLKMALESLPMVDAALITITLPENRRYMIWEDPEVMTAGVMIHLNAPISPAQVDTMERYVAGATGILPENITIMDGMMNGLNKKRDENDFNTAIGENYEYKRRFESDTARMISNMFNPIYGAANFSVLVNAVIDFDRRTSERRTFFPVVGDDEGIPRSVMTAFEYAKGLALPGGLIGTDPNGLGDEYPEVDEQLWNEYRNTQTTTNYDISELNERIEHMPGTLEDITVSIFINSDALMDTTENTLAVQRLIGSAIGYAENEFRRVVVEYMPGLGVRHTQEALDTIKAEEAREQMYELIQTLVLYFIIGICFILIILRTFAILRPKPVEIIGDMSVGDVPDYADALEAAEMSLELEVTKTPTRERVEEFIDNNPEAVATMLRTWLQEEEDSRW